MKKILSLLTLVSFFAVAANADYLVPGQPGGSSGPIYNPGPGTGPRPGGPGHGPGGGGPGWGHGPGHGPRPGHPHPGNPYPGNPYPSPYPSNPYPSPYPSNPYPAPYPPSYNDVYGPARTVRWQDMGLFKAQKVLETRVSIEAYGQLVNEVLLTAIDNPVQVNQALAYLTNGQVVDLRSLWGRIERGQQLRQPLDYRNSLRVSRIELNIESPSIFGGSRGTLQVHLGLAQ